MAGRPRKTNEDTLFNLIDRYIMFENPGVQVNINAFVRWINKNGYPEVSIHNVIRTKRVMKRIHEYNDTMKCPVAKGKGDGFELDAGRILKNCTSPNRTYENLQILVNLAEGYKNAANELREEKVKMADELSRAVKELNSVKKTVKELMEDNIELNRAMKILKTWLNESQEEVSAEEILKRYHIHMKPRLTAQAWQGNLTIPPAKKRGHKIEVTNCSMLNEYALHSEEPIPGLENTEIQEEEDQDDDFMSDFDQEYGDSDEENE